MSNLLDKASIILTPTAYNNGEALCVKPSDGSGDFDFSRNSAATRVNAQGLVENVQILSSNLVQNPSFSDEGVQEVSNGSFSQEGAELVTNGDFSSDTNWNKQTSNWTIANGYAICDGLQTTNSSLFQDLAVVNGNSYRIDFTITDSANDLNLILGATTIGQYGAGTHSIYVTKDANASARIFFQATASNGFQGSIDNCSVREVGQDWVLGTGVSIGENKALFTSTPSGQSVSQNAVASQIPNGTSVKVYFEVLSISSGSFGVYFSGSLVGSLNSVGVATFYFEKGTETSFYIRALGTTTGSITNISVKEVGQNWDFGGDWELVNGTAEILTSTNSFLVQSNVVDLSVKNYKLQYEVITTNGSNFRLAGGSSAFGTITLDTATIGVKTIYLTSNGTARNLQFNQNAFRGSIDNISVIEITDDTNLPRINYEGFSYQDALGSELLTDGNIINSGGGSFTFTPNGLIAISDGTSGTIARPILLWTTLTIGKQYRIVGTPTINSGNTNYGLYDGAAYVKNQVAVEAFDITFTCNGASVFFTNDGTQTFDIDWDLSIKEVLGQEPIPNSGCGHWLWEPQSTNLLPYSSDYTQWNKSGSMVITSNNAISPDGTQNASLLTANAANQFIYLTAFAAANSTISLYIKRKTGTGDIELSNNGGSSYTILSVTDEWNRVQVTFAAATNQTVIKINTSGDEIYLWGAQLEALSYASSYIPTEGTQKTRNQDVCTNGGSLASINSTEGVLYFEGASLTDSGSNRSISISDGTNTNQIVLRFSNTANQITAYITDGGSITASLNNTLSNSLNYNKIALKYKLNDVALWVNGVEVATDTNATMPSGFDVLKFSRADGANNFFAKTKALAVWKEALSDQELTELTTI